MIVEILFFKDELNFAEQHLKIIKKEELTDQITKCTIQLRSDNSVHEIWHTAIKFFIQKQINANISSTPLAPIL